MEVISLTIPSAQRPTGDEGERVRQSRSSTIDNLKNGLYNRPTNEWGMS